MAGDVNANIGVNIDTSSALAGLKNLQREISSFHTSVAKSSATAAASQKALQTNFINSVNSIKGFSAELRTVRTTAESFTNSLEKNKFSMGEYFRFSAASTKTFGKRFGAEFSIIEKTATERVKTLQTQFVKMGRDASGAMQSIAIRPTALDMSNLGTQAQIAAQKQAIFNQLIRQGSTNLLNFGKNTQWAGRQLMVGFTLPLVTLGVAAGKTFMDIEKQVIKFKKVYGDLFTADAEREKALDDIKALAEGFTQYGVAAADVISIAGDAAAAGFSGIDLQRQTEQAIRLSILGQLDYEKALETTISLQNAFQISSEELAESIDFLNSVENQTVVALDDITTAIPKVAPVIQALGGDVKDLAFFIAAMKESGVAASEGANALKSSLGRLINPTEAAKERLRGFGINIVDIVNRNAGNLRQTVIELGLTLDELDPLSRARAIEQLFGKFQFARMSALFENINKEGSQAARVLDLSAANASDLATTANDELGISAASAMNKFLKVVEDLKVALAPIGEVFLDVIAPILQSVADVIARFNDLPDQVKRTIALMVTVIGGLGPVILMTFGLLANGIANSIKFIALLRNGFLRLTGQTQILGNSTQYMTTEQLEATAAAMSLDQAHAKLTQRFTAEASAVMKLRDAYEAALRSSTKFATANPGAMMPGFRAPKGFAAGGSVGGSGNRDTVPAMLTPGEFVVNQDAAQSALPFLQALNAGKLPGFNDGGVVGKASPETQKIIQESRNVASAIDGIDDLLTQKLRELGQNLSPAKLRQELAKDPTLQLLSSSTLAKGRSTGSAGLVKMHSGAGGTSVGDVSQLSGIASPTQMGRLSRPGVSNVKLLDNMVFGGPAAANRGQLTGTEFGQFVKQNPQDFMGQIAKQSKVDASHPDFARFADNVAGQLASAGGRAIKESDFDSIIQKALAQEIDAIGKNTSQEVREAFAEARKASTIAYSETSATGKTVTNRMNIPKSARGSQLDIGGQPMQVSGQTPYRSVRVDPSASKRSDEFTHSVIRERGKKAGAKTGKVFADAAGEALGKSAKANSPSQKTKAATDSLVQGVEQGLREGADDVRAASAEIGRKTQSSRRASSGGVIKFDEKSGQYMRQDKFERQQRSREVARQRISDRAAVSMGNVMNKAQGLSFALSSVAGIASMFGGEVGQVAGIMFQLSSAMFGLITVTELLMRTQFAQNRLAAIKALPGMAMVKGGGVAGLFKNIGTVLKTVTKFLGGFGIAIAALAVAIPFLVKIVNDQKDRIEGLGKAARFTEEQLKGLAERFNVTLTESAIASRFAPAAAGATREQVSEATKLAQDEDFTKTYEKAIKAIEGATSEVAGNVLQALNVQLQASGFGPEAAHTIVMAIAQAAEKTDVDLSFAKIDLMGPEGAAQITKVAEQAVNSLRDAMVKGQGIMTQRNLSASAFANIFEALDIGLSSGRLSAKDFNEQMDGVVESLEEAADPALLNKIAENLDIKEELKQIKDYKNQILLIRGATSGVDAASFVGAFAISEDPRASAEERRQAAIGMKAFAKATDDAASSTEMLTKKQMEEASMLELNAELTEKLNQARQGIEDNIVATQNSIDTYNILIEQGFSAEEAFTAASNGGLALSIALAAANEEGTKFSLEEAIEQAREFFEITKTFEALKPPGSGTAQQSPFSKAIEDLKKQRDEIKATSAAYSKLRKAGIGIRDAFNLAKDPILAAAIASTKVGSSKWKELLNVIRQVSAESLKSFKGQADAFAELKSKAEEYLGIKEAQIEGRFRDRIAAETKAMDKLSEAIEGVQEEIQEYQDVIDEANRDIETTINRPIAELQSESNKLSNDLTLMDKAAEKINEKYDAQAKALEEVAKANQTIINQQKSQISLADALSQGDISQAAAIMQTMRGQNATAAAGSVRDALQAAREGELGALRSGSGMSREQIAERQFEISQKTFDLEIQRETKLLAIRDLEDTIFDITQDRLRPLERELKDRQDILDSIEDQKQAELDALQAIRDRWTDAQTAVDLAKAKAGEYNDVIKMGREITGGIVSNWTALKDKAITLTVKTVYQSVGAPTAPAPSPTSSSDPKPFTPLPSSRTFTPMAYGGRVKKMAYGGFVGGIGMTDKIPAMLTPGEFVVNRNAAKAFAPMLENLNGSKYPSMMRGRNSLMGPSFKLNSSTVNSVPVQTTTVNNTTGVNPVYNYSLSVNVSGSSVDANTIANTVMSKIQQMDSQRIRRQVSR